MAFDPHLNNLHNFSARPPQCQVIEKLSPSVKKSGLSPWMVHQPWAISWFSVGVQGRETLWNSIYQFLFTIRKFVFLIYQFSQLEHKSEQTQIILQEIIMNCNLLWSINWHRDFWMFFRVLEDLMPQKMTWGSRWFFREKSGSTR